jgi:hypothetical protein
MPSVERDQGGDIMTRKQPNQRSVIALGSAETKQMQDEVAILIEAIHLAQQELADYMDAGAQGRVVNPEITIAKLTGILGQAALLRADAVLSRAGKSGAPIAPAPETDPLPPPPRTRRRRRTDPKVSRGEISRAAYARP